MKRINKELLKSIIIENKNFILENKTGFVERERFRLPSGNLEKVIILYGVRRSGKTYILYHLMHRYPDCSLYIDFEDERLTGFTVDDFETLREAFFELYPYLVKQTVFFLLDEIQRVPEWEKFCRRLTERTPIQVIVAGSSSRIHPEHIHTTLRGRAWSLEILPFSFKECLAYNNIGMDDYNALFSDMRFRLLDIFDSYMKWGGFPEVITAGDEFTRRKIIREYLDALFFKDLVERYSISNITLLNSLKNKIFSSFSTPFSLSAFYKQTKGAFPISKDLLFQYYQYMLDVGLSYEVRMFSDSVYKKIRNPAKVYVVDPCLAQRVAHNDTARLLENIVFLELVKSGMYQGIHYYSGAKECDFIIKGEEGIFPIQVTYTMQESNRQREIDGLLEASQRLGVHRGIILTYNEEEFLTVQGLDVHVLPVWKWLLKK